jgi:hypothetical protein
MEEQRLAHRRRARISFHQLPPGEIAIQFHPSGRQNSSGLTARGRAAHLEILGKDAGWLDTERRNAFTFPQVPRFLSICP